MNSFPVICFGCATVGSVNKVTSGLRCTCGSTDLDYYTGTQEQIARIAQADTDRILAEARASRENGVSSFKDFMLHKEADSEQLRGWSEYEGPMPGPNQMSNHVKQPITCPTCLGLGVDIKDDGGPCRACGGKGTLTPTTSVTPEPAVYKHQYPSTQTTVPFMGRRKNGGRRSADPMGSVEDHIKATTPGYGTQVPVKAAERSPAFGYRDERDYSQPGSPHVMPGTSCPTCGAGPLGLQKDHRENAWMSCPTCGPLADIDANPSIDPYNLGDNFAPTRGYKAAKKVFAGKKTGRLLNMIATIAQANPGLSQRETLHLARTSLRKYPESK